VVKEQPRRPAQLIAEPIKNDICIIDHEMRTRSCARWCAIQPTLLAAPSARQSSPRRGFGATRSASDESGFHKVFETMAGQKADALLAGMDTFFVTRREQLIRLAARYRVPRCMILGNSRAAVSGYRARSRKSLPATMWDAPR